LLAATIEKRTSEVARLKKEVGKHETDITGWDKDKEAATKVRKTERGTFLTTQVDLQESVEALAQAIIMLKQQPKDVSAVSLLQKVSSLVESPADQQAINAFLEQQAHLSKEPNPSNNLGYKATAYKSQSGGIIEMLEKLKAKFKGELTKTETTEVARRKTFTSLMQDIADQTKDAENAIQEKTVTGAKNKQSSIEKSSDLKDTTGVRNVDMKYLKDLSSLCDQKTAEFKSRSKLRDDEMEALDKAVEILSGDDVGDAKKRLNGFVQTGSSFAQIRGSSMSPDQRRLIDFLRTESVRLDSHDLSTLAMEATQSNVADPFGKIKNLIQELITRLKTQATNEATHKGWCDKELGTNKHTRTTKSAEVETLTATIEGLDSDLAKNKKDNAKKTKEVAELEAAVAKFTGERKKETASNAAAVKDAKEGQTAIAGAIKVLQEFYAKAAKAKAASFVSIEQGGRPKVPEIFDGAYQGQQDTKGGVIGMLDVIKSDFTRLEADTKSAEAAAQSEYDSFMSDSAQTKASLDVDLKHLKSTKLAKEGELGMAKENLVTSQKTLDMALKSFEKLKEPCMKEPMSYAERKARRKDEIESLKSALELLSGDMK